VLGDSDVDRFWLGGGVFRLQLEWRCVCHPPAPVEDLDISYMRTLDGIGRFSLNVVQPKKYISGHIKPPLAACSFATSTTHGITSGVASGRCSRTERRRPVHCPNLAVSCT